MPYKRDPTDAETEDLAKRLQTLWRPKDAVRPWLKKHGEVLHEVLHSGGSWVAVAAALNRAGIMYQTGNLWTGSRINREYHRANKKDKALTSNQKSDRISDTNLEHDTHSRDRQSVSLKIGEKSSPHDVSGSPETPITANPAKLDSRFKPFTLKPYAPARDLTPEEIREREELQARLFGKS